MRTFITRTLSHLPWIALFTVAYYLPWALSVVNRSFDPRVEFLFEDALRTSAVKSSLALNGLVHFALILGCYWVLMGIASQIESQGVSRATSRLASIVLGWIALISSNAVAFPDSAHSYAFWMLNSPTIAATLVGIIGVLALRRLFVSSSGRVGLIILATICASLFGFSAIHSRSTESATVPTRNVIIIGVDSLSQSLFTQLGPELPELNDLFRHAIHFENAYTTLGRTFPAWASILSGEYPAEHRAVFNLRNMDLVNRSSSVAFSLRNRGYKTVFALDERRFNNIDETFGFDAIVGPKVGVLDFVLQSVNDTPLTNFLLQVPLAGRLLPYSHFNSASFVNYDADGFVDAVLEQVTRDQPIFLATHFESAHFPYKTRHSTRLNDKRRSLRSAHISALRVADSQVGRLVRGLAENGALDEAMLIILSDHGEDFGTSAAETLETTSGMTLNSTGHGNNILSELQNRILLGVVQFRNGVPISMNTRREQVASLVDIRQAIDRYVKTGEADITPRSECYFVETGINPRAARNLYDIKMDQVVAEMGEHYEVNNLGLLQIREASVNLFIAGKDVGLRCKNRITIFSSQESQYFSFFTNITGSPVMQQQPPQEDVSAIEVYRKSLLYSASRPEAAQVLTRNMEMGIDPLESSSVLHEN